MELTSVRALAGKKLVGSENDHNADGDDEHAKEVCEIVVHNHPRECLADLAISVDCAEKRSHKAQNGDVAEDGTAMLANQRIQHHQQSSKDRQNDLGQETDVFDSRRRTNEHERPPRGRGYSDGCRRVSAKWFP